VTIDRISGDRKPNHDSADNVPDFWNAAKRHLDEVEAADEEYQAKAAPGEVRPLERTFGPIIDRLLLHEGIRKVDSDSREMLLRAFYLALKDAFDSRERNARGDYRPDANAERFPELSEQRRSRPHRRIPPAAAALLKGRTSRRV
jgi:hypothetical protein